MRLGLVGDVHANTRWFSKILKTAREDECDLIVQLGDFGIWSQKFGQEFKKEIKNIAQENNIPIFVIPGNHDNYNLIEGLEPDDEGWLVWDDTKIRIAPRGHTWVWDKLLFGAMGGAVSIDKYSRIEDISWWRQEAITREEAYLMTKTVGKLDVLLVHDTPQGAHENYTENDAWNSIIPRDLLEKARQNRVFLRNIVDATTPEWVFGGHWHEYLDSTIQLWNGQETRVINLDCDDNPKSYLVFDTQTKNIVS